MTTPIFKTKLMTDAEPGHLLICDTILLDGKYWIVPQWLEDKKTKKRQPERIILLDNLKYQISDPDSGHHFFLGEAIPKEIFCGELPAQTTYHVIIQPEVFVDTQAPATFH